MTLSIAATFPPERIGRFHYTNFPWPLERGIVLATDSRLTYSGIGTEDIGNKVFQIAKGIGLVYAGNSQIANIAIPKVTYSVKQHHAKSPLPRITDAIRRVLRNVYSTYISRNQRLPPHLKHVRFLLGMYNLTGGDTHLVDFISPHFEPLERNGLIAIGSNEKVRERFVERIHQSPDHTHSYPTATMQYATLIAVALGSIIDEKLDPGVGGITEIATIGPDGLHTLSHVVLDENLEKIREVTTAGDGWCTILPDGTTPAAT